MDNRGGLRMAGEFEGKIVVISGASRGIGRGIALAFARAGAQTVLASSSEQNLAAAAKMIAAQGPQPLTVAGDLRTLAACEQLFHNVNVNVIHPGHPDTERQDGLRRQRAAALGRTVDELRVEALSKSNVRRFGKPEDIAALVLFLCSERARHVQGTAIAVDGGATPGL